MIVIFSRIRKKKKNRANNISIRAFVKRRSDIVSNSFQSASAHRSNHKKDTNVISL